MRKLLFLSLALIWFTSCEKNTDAKVSDQNAIEQTENEDIAFRGLSANCSGFEFSAIKISSEDPCCDFSVSIVPTGGQTTSNVIDYYLNGVFQSSLTVFHPVSIPFHLCYDEEALVEFYVNGELCYSEVLFCADCCSYFTYTVVSKPFGDCCRHYLRVNGPSLCLQSMNITVIGNPDPISTDDIIISGNRAIVTTCDPDVNAVFYVSIFGETCWRSEFLNVGSCDK